MNPLLTIVVPCYNSEKYMEHSINSLLSPGFADVEVIIVNDGSSDGTEQIAEDFAARYPGVVRAVHKVNGGHGSAINAGLLHARGTYLKVVDSDDWLDAEAFGLVLDKLRARTAEHIELDMLVTNFVYEKEGKTRKRSVHYRRALPRNRVLGWHEVRTFWTWQYLLMHSLIYRTEILREIGLQVPEKSFYVDNYFAFVPMPHVKKLEYLDVDFYRYFIGRSDQSVNEKVMIGRIDQQINVNLLMVDALSRARQTMILPASLERYMVRYATLVSAVSSVLLLRDGTPGSLEKKRKLWESICAADADLNRELRKPLVGAVVSRNNWASNAAMRVGYHLSRVLVGFN